MAEIEEVSMSGVIYKKCDEDFQISVNQILLAIKAYRLDHGDHPSSLDELVPRYLSSVPSDPFGDQQIRYDNSKKILYSVGQGGVDVGGSVGEDWRAMANPTFKIDF